MQEEYDLATRELFADAAGRTLFARHRTPCRTGKSPHEHADRLRKLAAKEFVLKKSADLD
jgi:hypothetical protein